MQNLDGRVAIVTGASSGVGRGLATVLARQGAKVCACARRLENLNDLKDEMSKEGAEVLPVVCDVTDPAQIKAAVAACVDRFGGVDILANCAQGSMLYREISGIHLHT